MNEITDTRSGTNLPSVPAELLNNPEFGTVVNSQQETQEMRTWRSEAKIFEQQDDLVVRLTDVQKRQLCRLASDSGIPAQQILDEILSTELEGRAGRPMISRPSWAVNNRVSGYSGSVTRSDNNAN